jgi:agmatine deiminase
MITDIQTNKLFLADCLPEKQPKFFQRFEKVLNDCKINFQFLPNTKDIWAVDFMPVQVSKDKFVRFTYNPDYLQPKKYRKTISHVDTICKSINK